MLVDPWGIPFLNFSMRADRVVPPVTKWGTVPVRSRIPGTVHFYAYDHNWAGTLRRPRQVPDTGCAVAVELNFSTYPAMPRAVVLHDIYRKRALARSWQDAGVRVLVDLNVDPAFRDLALLGVPRGWDAFATRKHRDFGLEALDADFAAACAHAEEADPLFVVFGGGRAVAGHCAERGWEWVPEHRQVVAGREAPYGQGR